MNAVNLRIGDWVLDRASGELSTQGRMRQLTPKSTSLLCALAERAGELVTKEELFDNVWSGAVVSDAALTSCIRELREAFADDAKQPRYIETLHRRGYRLIAKVDSDSIPAQADDAPRRLAIAGRERELALLRSTLACALDGERQVLFVTGDPGIGKSALVESFLRGLAPRQVRVARGHCIEHHGPAEAYLPVLEAIDRLCRDSLGERTKQVLAQHAPGWLAQMPGLLSNAELRALSQRTAGATPQRLLRELTHAVEVLAAQTPLALLFEDLHWSDSATLDWLAFIARRTEPARLLIIATYRGVEVLARGHPLINVHAELKSQGRALQIPVAPLSRDAMESLMAMRFGDGDVIRTLARRVHARTEGHPLFALNMIDELIARGALQLRDAAWRFSDPSEPIESLVPGDVRRTIEHRVQRLSADDQQLLQLASVVGAQFSTAAVAAGCAQPEHEVEAALNALAQQDTFIRIDGEEEWADRTYTGRYAFHHALYREVLYDRMPVGARAAAHLRIGDRLERSWGARAEEIATELAVHFEKGRDPARGVRWRQRAGHNAVRRGAPYEAIAHLNKARDALQNLPDSAGRVRTEIEICIALGSQLMATGGWGAPEVEKTYSHAQRLCEQLTDQREVFPALWGLWLYRSGHGELREAQELCETLLDLAAGADPALQLQARHAAWATALARGDLDSCCRRALEGAALYVPHGHHELSERYGNHDAGVCALCFHSLALALRGERQAAADAGRAALALAQELDHPFSSAFANYFAGALHQMLGDADTAAEFAEAAIRLARDQSFGLILAWASCIRGWAQVRRSKCDDAIAAIAQNVDAARASGTDLFQTYLLGLLAEACLETGNTAAGLEAVERGQAAARRSGEMFYIARLLCLQAQLSMQAPDPPQRTEITAMLDQAIASARAQGAVMIERQAIMVLAQLQERSG